MNEAIEMPSWPHFSDEEIAAVTNILRSGKVNYWTGTEGVQFEREFANYVNVNHAVALSNGTVALELALLAIGIGTGDEVILPSRTFIATASSVVARGAIPVIADVDRDSQNITAKTIEPLITSKTKAIIIVHLAGWPGEMNEISALAKAHHLYVIEDCAQAHGAMYHNKQVGSLSDIAAFSYCQDKIMTTAGEGGMITTDNEAFFKTIWEYKDHGKNYDKVHEKASEPGFRWLHDSFGSNGRMTEIQAAIGRIQLKKLTHWIHKRQQNANRLTSLLAELPCLRIPKPDDFIQHAYYKYYCFLKPEYLKSNWTQTRIIAEILQQGVPCYSGSCSEIYREQAFVKMGYEQSKRLPVAKELGETSLMFLVHPTLEDKHMDYAADKIKKVLKQAVR